MTTDIMENLEFPIPVTINFDAVDKAVVFMRGIFPSAKKMHKIYCQMNPDKEPRKASPYRHQHKELAKVIKNLIDVKKKTIEIVNKEIERMIFLDKVCSLHALAIEKFVIKGNKKKRAWMAKKTEELGLEYKPMDL